MLYRYDAKFRPILLLPVMRVRLSLMLGSDVVAAFVSVSKTWYEPKLFPRLHSGKVVSARQQ